MFSLLPGYSCYNSFEPSNDSYFFSSPSGRIRVRLFIKNNSTLTYKITDNKRTIIDTSLLGIMVNNKYYGLIKGFEEIKKSENQEGLSVLYGKYIKQSSSLKYIIPIDDKNGHKWYLEAILSDNGYAFRYIIPGKGTQHVNEEKTNFRLPDNSRVWYFERNNYWKLKSYAGEWLSASIDKMPFVSKEGPIQGIPLVIQSKEDQYTVIAEAGCYNYSGMRLKAIGSNTFQSNFTEDRIGFSLSDTLVTPWRAILFADNLNELVNNTFIAQASPKPDSQIYADMSYIKPGKCIWRWWANGTGTAAQEKDMISKASELQAQYVMIDDGWEKWPNAWEEIKSICEYAHEKNIGVWLWKDSHDLQADTIKINTWLDSVKRGGAVGVKVDFFNSESKDIILFQKEIILAAARRRLMIDLHGCSAGSGEYYSFPNQLTREGIRGLELNKLDEGPISASHNAALPFTRFLMGPADYTPLGLTAPGNTSWAHQLATLVTFSSPLMVIAEDPDFLLSSMYARQCLPFIKALPTVWDKTIVLPQSKFGELCAIARRSGNKWFIGIINAGKARNYTINISFLNDQHYCYQFYSDDTSGKKLNINGINSIAMIKGDSFITPFCKTKGSIISSKKINIHLAANGEFAAMILPGNAQMKQ